MPKTLFPLSGLRTTDHTFPLLFREGNGKFDYKTRDIADYDLRAFLRRDEDGFEVEVSEQIRQRNPQLRAPGRFVPWEIFTRGLSTRDVTAGGSTSGASFIELERVGSIADALRPVSAVVASGATVIENQNGNNLNGNNLSLPRWATPSTPAAYSEIAGLTANSQTSSALQLTAHRISSATIVSRQLLVQTTNMQLERLIQLEMLRSIGSVIDAYALTGSGAGGQPLGLLNYTANTAGARDLAKIQPTITFGAAATWAKVNSFPASVEGTDIPDDGTYGWVTSPSTKYKWSAAVKVASYPSFLYENGKVGDSPLRASNSLSSTHQAVFGRWSDLILCLWPVSVLVDPLSQATSANVKIYLDIFCDVGALRAPAFCISSDSAAQ